MSPLSRRSLLKALAATAGVAAAPSALQLVPVARAADGGPLYLIVLGCFGGASMLDMFMPVDSGNPLLGVDSARGQVINYATATSGNGVFRCPNRPDPLAFLSKHSDEMAVLAYQATSVNHFLAQERIINGRNAFNGRTLCEAVAAFFGSSMALPNVNMGRGGFLVSGKDRSLPSEFRDELVTNPITFSLATHGSRGVLPLAELTHGDPDLHAAALAATRSMRDNTLETLSPFARTFGNSVGRRAELARRQGVHQEMAAADLITKLWYERGENLGLEHFGLDNNTELGAQVREAFPGAMAADLETNPVSRFDSQCALAFLLLVSGHTCSVTLTTGEPYNFLSFDQSHGTHIEAQGLNWDIVLSRSSTLIQLLKGAEYHDANGPTGTSLWDRSMLVYATEFGRDKWMPSPTFGTGHHLNNGTLVVSPLIQGGQILGTTDPTNGWTTGFDLETGAATPFEQVQDNGDPYFDDPNLPPGEDVIYGALLDVLGISFPGQKTIPVLRKS